VKRTFSSASKVSFITQDLSVFDTYQLTKAIVLVLAYSREKGAFLGVNVSLNLNTKTGLVFLADNAGNVGVAHEGKLKQWAVCKVCGAENFVDSVNHPRFFHHTLCDQCAATPHFLPTKKSQKPLKGKPMKVYHIERTRLGTVHATVNGHPLPRVEYHSKSGFNFGNASKESMDLALSILADYYEEFPTPEQLHQGNCVSWSKHQKFTWHFLAHASESTLTITEEEILFWLIELEKKQ
jgi:hypothetical protein